MFRGTYTALVTPFRNGAIDEPAFAALIEAQITAGITGIIPVGTTGESPTLNHSEHARVIELAVQFAAGRCPVIAGTGSNATSEAIALTQQAENAGVDAALIVAPYYNKPSQEGLFRHFKEIAEATQLPIVLYSIPGRCGIEISVTTVVRLAATCPNIVAIKEAGGSVERVSQLRGALPAEFDILSGDDALTLPFISVGAVGVISVASNLIPAEMVELVDCALAGNLTRAGEIHTRLHPLFKDLFLEPNPVPVKQALAWRGVMTAACRLPLCELSDASSRQLRTTLNTLDLV